MFKDTDEGRVNAIDKRRPAIKPPCFGIILGPGVEALKCRGEYLSDLSG